MAGCGPDMAEPRSGNLIVELRRLREENARLKALLVANGIPWEEGRLGSASSGLFLVHFRHAEFATAAFSVRAMLGR